MASVSPVKGSSRLVVPLSETHQRLWPSCENRLLYPSQIVALPNRCVEIDSIASHSPATAAFPRSSSERCAARVQSDAITAKTQNGFELRKQTSGHWLSAELQKPSLSGCRVGVVDLLVKLLQHVKHLFVLSGV